MSLTGSGTPAGQEVSGLRGGIRHRASRLFDLLFREQSSPFFIQWSPAGAETAMREVHRCASRVAWPYYPQPVRWLLLASSVVWWPFRAAVLAVRYARYYGPGYEPYAGKSPLRQAADQWRVALRYSIPSYEYYAYELFRPEHRARAAAYLHEYEIKHLLAFLNRYRRPGLLSDKLRFAEACARSEVSTVPVLAESARGELRFVDGQPGLPARDLFVKPRYGARGAGAARWVYHGEERFERHDGLVLSRSELTAHLAALSRDGTSYLVQPRLAAHPAVADLTLGALPTARIVTGRTVEGDVEPVLAVYKIPTGTLVTDYHDAQAIISPVEMETGRLGAAVPLALTWRRFDAHPDTGAPITGRKLPGWEQALTLARRAHALLDDFVFIGWDVALTAEGPVLLEGNAYWSARLMQRPHARPLGDTIFARICLGHLRQTAAAPVVREADGRPLHLF